MSVLVALQHVTRYRYDRPVVLGPQVIRLRPAPHCRTAIQSYSLKVTPGRALRELAAGPERQLAGALRLPRAHRPSSASAVDLLADMSVINPFDFFVDPVASHYPVHLSERVRRGACALSQQGAGRAAAHRVSEVAAARAADHRRLHRRAQPAHPARRPLSGPHGPGRADDRGHARARLRLMPRLRLAAGAGAAPSRPRGALRVRLPDPARSPTSRRSTARPAATDFTDLHAWAEVYLPGAGWIGMDPTSGLLTGEGHIPLAATPHYRAAAPISGGVEPAKVDFHFEMKLTRVDEKPRVTYPFSDEAWIALDALGERVDADLATQDVRLTMGGEPTFVSVDDYQAAEWNTAALGPTKREHRRSADPPAARPSSRPGGLIHHGQGKWYPGEPLPRWAFYAALAQGRQAGLAERGPDRARDRSGAPAPPTTRIASPRVSPAASASPPIMCCRPSKTPPSGC